MQRDRILERERESGNFGQRVCVTVIHLISVWKRGLIYIFKRFNFFY
jgi:hypothetical protein